MDHLNKRGIMVTYWVLNSESDFEKAKKHGVNGIVTDSNVLLRNWINA